MVHPIAADATPTAPPRKPKGTRSDGNGCHTAPMPDSVLSDGTIRRLVEAGEIVLRPWNPDLVQPASVDLRLGDTFRVFHNHRAAVIDLKEGPPKALTEEVVATPEDGF